VRRFLLTLWNTYSFYVQYALIDDVDISAAPPVEGRHVLDRWCLARLAGTIDDVRTALDTYDATDATRTLELFVDDVSKWYVRRSRNRFWSSASVSGNGDGGGTAVAGPGADKLSAQATLFTVLHTLSRLLAPFMPFVSERMYRNLSGFEGDVPPPAGTPDSVHLTDYPVAEDAWYDPELVVEMQRVRNLVEKGLGARKGAGIRVKQPLAAATVLGAPFAPGALEGLFADELNVKGVVYANRRGQYEDVELDTVITEALRLEGLVREVSRKVNELRKQAGFALEDRITVRIDAAGDLRRAVAAHREHLMAETLATVIDEGRGVVLSDWEGELAGEAVWVGVTR
jgi:isoleucyl-tRNA synthetase